MNVLVFIPTYNDVASLATIIAEVRSLKNHYSILVLDDGSTEDVSVASDRDDLRTFRLPGNFGLGVCTHIALDHALARGYDVVCRVDADGQHPIGDIPRLLECLVREQADLVVGSRLSRGRQSGFRGGLAALVKAYFALVAGWMTGGTAPADVNSGFFCVGVRAMRVLNELTLERYPEPQLYISACRLGLRVREIGIEQRSREFGRSTLNLGQALRMFYRFNIFVISELLQKAKS